MGNARGFASSEGDQVDSVDLAVARQLGPSRSGGCRVKIEMVHRVRHRGPGLYPRRPLCKEGNVNASLEEGDLPTPKGAIHVGKTDITSPAIIRCKKNQRIFIEPVALQSFEHPPYPAIEASNHAGVNALAMVRDMRERFIILPGRLQRRVGSPMREIKEEGAILVGLNHGHGLIGVIVGQITRRLEEVPAIEGSHKAKSRPEKAIDGVKILFRVDHLRMILGQVEPAHHEKALVESLILGGHPPGAPKMPLADMGRVIALLAQQFREADLRGRHSHGFVFHGLDTLGEDRSAKPLNRAIEIRDDLHHPGWCRGELEPETGPVTP